MASSGRKFTILKKQQLYHLLSRLWAECLIVRPCTITIVALTFAKYSVKLLFPECEPPDTAVRLTAAALICTNICRNIVLDVQRAVGTGSRLPLTIPFPRGERCDCSSYT